MTDQSHTTNLTTEGNTPRDATTVSLPDLRPLTMGELRALYDAVQTMGDALLAFVNKPLVQSAGEAIGERYKDHFGNLLEAIAAEAKGRAPTNATDHERRAEILVAWLTQARGEWGEASRIAADMEARVR